MHAQFYAKPATRGTGHRAPVRRVRQMCWIRSVQAPRRDTDARRRWPCFLLPAWSSAALRSTNKTCAGSREVYLGAVFGCSVASAVIATSGGHVAITLGGAFKGCVHLFADRGLPRILETSPCDQLNGWIVNRVGDGSVDCVEEALAAVAGEIHRQLRSGGKSACHLDIGLDLHLRPNSGSEHEEEEKEER